MTRSARVAFAIGLLGALFIGAYAFPRFLYGKVEQPLPFSHRLHTEKAGLACQDCHALRADGSFAGVPPLANCANCHSEVQGKTEGERRLVEEYVKPGREIPWRIYARQPDNAHFPHAQHIQRGELKCERCHGPQGQSETLRPYEFNRVSGYSRDIWGPSIYRLGLAPWQGMKMSDCERCHREMGRGGNSCLACHK